MSCISCVLLLLAIPVAAQPLKIAFVDGIRIDRESKRMQQASEVLKQEFASRAAELDDLYSKVTAMQSELDKLGPDVPAAELDKKRREFSNLAQRFEQTRRTFEEDLNRRKAEERQKFFLEITAVVKKIAEAQHFDLVVQQAVYASHAIDITEEVMKALDEAQAGAEK